MNIALYSSFLEGDIWTERLLTVTQYNMCIDEFNDTVSLIEAISQKQYDVIIVALDNSNAVIAIEKIRKICCDISLLWISDSKFETEDYENIVTAFVDKDAFEHQVHSALEKCTNRKQKIV